MSRFRAWCFTVNNPSDLEKTQLRELGTNDDVRYILLGFEIGAQLTPHVQGYVEFKKAMTMTAVKALMPRAHLENRRGTQAQATAYCKKDGVFQEFGECAKQGSRTDITDFLDTVRRGATTGELAEDHPVEFVKYCKAAELLRGSLGHPRTTKTEVSWYHGATGCGKTRKAFEENAGAYFKDMSEGKWWDGYLQQSCVILDDMRRDTFKFHELLRLFDRYPLRIQYKGGSTEFNSQKIVVTSCMTPDDMYNGRSDEDINQLIRRIDIVLHIE